MRDTNRYGAAYSGRVQFGRQAAVASTAGPVAAGIVLIVDRLVIANASVTAGLLVAVLAYFLAFLGLGLGVAAHIGLRRKRHDRFRLLASIGIAASLLFLTICLVAPVLLQRNGEPVPDTAANPHTSNPAENPAPGTARRPIRWATRVERPGLPNLHKVSARLYRGAQPTAEGMRQLRQMGVKTVVNLRKFHSDRDEIGDTCLGYEHIYFNPLHPEEKEIVRFLQIVTDKSRVPAFVHCQRGADRTGTMCAIYRIAVQGWTKGKAIEEMTNGGFGHHEKIFGNLRNYIRKLDVQAIKRRARLADKE